jgi:S1-C subfamily serine protease
LENDTIIKFDGQAVQDFAELTAAIAKKTGGEKVEIELLRPSDGDTPPKLMTVPVRLGSW